MLKLEVLGENKMAAAAIFVELQREPYLDHLWTDFDEIWNTGTNCNFEPNDPETGSTARKQYGHHRHLFKTNWEP